MFQVLLVDLFTFLAPFLRNSDLGKATQLLYKVMWSGDSHMIGIDPVVLSPGDPASSPGPLARLPGIPL